MKEVKIYLRSISQDKEQKLSLFDSNGAAGIDDLVTIVNGGDLVIWEPDCISGIKEIIKIYPKKGEGSIFRYEPKKTDKGFVLEIPEDAKGEEAYGINYLTDEGKEINVDPYLKIPPPPDPDDGDN